MLVSIIIINYNTFTITCNCINSIISKTKDIAYEIILVDNASPTDEPDKFLEKFPTITLIKNKENAGFAKGNNIGISAAKGDIILLLNSDTILIEDSISLCASFLMKNKHIGAIEVKLVYENGEYQKNARAFKSLRNEILDIFRPLLWLLPYKTRANLFLNQYFRGDYDTFCDWLSGAFLMIPKEAINKLPQSRLDERYFMYGEDQLWCYQLSQLGYKIYFFSGSSVIHIGNASTEPSKQLKLLRSLIKREIDVMRYRKGPGAYYYTFKIMYTIKELTRYSILSAYHIIRKRHAKSITEYNPGYSDIPSSPSIIEMKRG